MYDIRNKKLVEAYGVYNPIRKKNILPSDGQTKPFHEPWGLEVNEQYYTTP